MASEDGEFVGSRGVAQPAHITRIWIQGEDVRVDIAHAVEFQREADERWAELAKQARTKISLGGHATE